MFCYFPFLSLLFKTRKPCFPLEKGILCLFLSVSLCFSLASFGLPLFQVFFLCLSLLLVLFSSFLCFFFALFCFLVFVSFFFFLSSLLLLHEKNNIKILTYKVFLHQYFLLFWFPVFFSLWNPFLLSLHCPDFKLCFLFNIIVFGFKKNPSWKKKKHKCWVKRGVATKRYFLWACVLQNVKSYRFLGPCFWQSLVDVQKHYKIGISAHFWKQKKQKIPFFNVINWSKSKLLTGPSWGFKTKGQLELGPVNNFENLRAQFFNFKKLCRIPYFIVLFDKTMFWKKKNKFEPVNNFENPQTWTS